MQTKYQKLNLGEIRGLVAQNLVARLAHKKLGNIARALQAARWFVRCICFNPRLRFVKKTKSPSLIITQRLKRDDLMISQGEIAEYLSCSEALIELKFGICWEKLNDIAMMFYTNNMSLQKYMQMITIIEYNEVKRSLQRQGKDFSLLISFNEKQYFEGQFLIAGNNLNFNTLSLAHGFYRDTGKKLTIDNTNVHNYMRLNSKYHITFGTLQSSIMQKYSNFEKKYFDLGKPSLILPEIDRWNVNVKDNVLVLDSKELSGTNAAMVDCASDINNLCLKRHPDDDGKYKIQEIPNFESIANPVDCCFWGCNSTALLQLGRAGYSVCLFKKSDFLQYIPDQYLQSIGEFYRISINYNWLDFIKLTGDAYFQELSKIIGCLVEDRKK